MKFSTWGERPGEGSAACRVTETRTALQSTLPFSGHEHHSDRSHHLAKRHSHSPALNWHSSALPNTEAGHTLRRLGPRSSEIHVLPRAPGRDPFRQSSLQTQLIRGSSYWSRVDFEHRWPPYKQRGETQRWAHREDGGRGGDARLPAKDSQQSRGFRERLGTESPQGLWWPLALKSSPEGHPYISPFF